MINLTFLSEALIYTDYKKFKEKFDKEQAYRRLCFARFCWLRRDELTPNKMSTWEERFEELEGISLQKYAGERISERIRKEKKLSHNK